MYQKLSNYDVTLKSLESITKKLDNLIKEIPKKKIFLGFDGYVDSLYSLVKSRESATKWNKMESLKTFGELMVKIAGSSANVERVLKRKISGGFAPNTCKAINGLGTRVYLIAALGYPNIVDTFKTISSKESVEAISFNNPGETAGLEFDDGKVMLTDFENINGINWELIIKRIGRDTLINKLESADAVGLGHWSLVPHMNEIWIQMVKEIFPSMKTLKKKLFFFDLADVKKRTKSDMLEMLNILKKIDDQAPVMLSLNDQEASDISKVIDETKKIDPNKKDFADYIEGGLIINKKANLSYVVIHSPHFATITTKKEHSWVTEGFTSKPRYTTGAGDHFHGAVAVGLICQLTPSEAILMGNALTAIFVRTGNSPNFGELSQFIKRYMEYVEKDNPDFP